MQCLSSCFLLITCYSSKATPFLCIPGIHIFKNKYIIHLKRNAYPSVAHDKEEIYVNVLKDNLQYCNPQRQWSTWCTLMTSQGKRCKAQFTGDPHPGSHWSMVRTSLLAVLSCPWVLVLSNIWQSMRREPWWKRTFWLPRSWEVIVYWCNPVGKCWADLIRRRILMCTGKFGFYSSLSCSRNCVGIGSNAILPDPVVILPWYETPKHILSTLLHPKKTTLKFSIFVHK